MRNPILFFLILTASLINCNSDFCDKTQALLTTDQSGIMEDNNSNNNDRPRIPPVFISHGSPMLYTQKETAAYAFLKDFGKQIQKDYPALRAIVVFSAHWESETKAVRVNTAVDPPQIYDFYGFPKFAYEFKYRPKGNPEVAQRVIELLQAANIPVEPDNQHGLDHGTWSPLSISFPQANVPMVQVSLHGSLDPKLHLKIGEALSALQYENVLIIGSGSATHNFGHLRMDARADEVHPDAKQFEQFITDIVTNKKGVERTEALGRVQESPLTRKAHPRTEHLIPICIPAGAGVNFAARILHRTFMGYGLSMAAFAF